MSNQSNGRKKSVFVEDTTIPADATFDFVTLSSNRKISFANMLTAFGTTGTLVQQGNVLGTPVLNKVGTVNNIRNLEDGFGVKSSVSPQGGITLNHNFTQNTDGAKPVVNLSVTQPILRSFIAGTGISIAEDGNRIQIAAVAAPTSTKTVVISQESDLPSVVSGRHPLADDTDYLFVNDINTGLDGFLLGNNTVVRAADSSIVQLTYTGTNSLFKSVSDSNKVTKIRLNAPNAVLLELTGAADYVFQFVDASVTACTGIGTMADFQAAQINNISFENNTASGLTFSGTNGVLLMNGNLIVQAAGTMIDLGSATFTGLSLDTNFVALAAGVTFLDGAASSANMVAGATGTVINTKNLTGLGTMLATISPDDAQWEFQLNDDIANTRPDALAVLISNATETVISASSTDGSNAVLVAGTWIEERSSQFAITAAGRLTYLGAKTAVLPVTASFSAKMASGGSNSCKFYIAKNGVVIANSGAQNDMNSSSNSRTTLPWQLSFDTNDFVEVFAENNANTVNILVSDATHRVD
jgi:hypothetical protein